MTPALNQRPWSTSRRFTPIRRWAGGLIRMIPAFGLRSSVVPKFPARPFTGQWPGPGPAAAADPATEERYPRRDDHGVKPDPLANQLLAPSATPATGCGHNQIPQIDRRVQVPVMPGPTVGAGPPAFPLQLRVHGPANAAGLAAGEPHGRQDDLGVAPLPLVDQLTLDVAHSGVGLGPRGIPPHQPGDVQAGQSRLKLPFRTSVQKASEW